MFRIYFLRDGVELSDHPLNGAEWEGSGASVGYRDGVPCRSELWVFNPGRKGTRCVTVADFGGEPVKVKVWSPVKSEFWYLV